MKLVKKLTKANCEKYGIEVAPELDFSDDGNKFRGFMYNGMPMTQCYADGTCYLCIRVDYLSNSFTYKEWMNTEEYYLCDQFNGVNEFDIEKLIENLEKVIAKVEEMNSSSSVSEADIENVKEVILDEVNKIEGFMDNVKINFKWWSASTAYLSRIADYMKTLEEKVKLGRNVADTINSMGIRNQKEWIENSCRSNVLGAKFYMETITELINKVK